MPIYEYRCKKCQKEFECLVLGNGTDVRCPECDGSKVERLMSTAAFKSSGKYVSSSPSSACSSCSGGSCSSCR
ncbi:MAG: zinc ribbon domain-containing protein [Deltaproteobacteria bacterium]|nr:zinc ribbon domain-containing protein [Deltaproteobacteria bacterium]